MAEERTTSDPPGGSERVSAASFASPRRSLDRSRTRALHVCPCCDSELVYPTDWSPVGRRRWRVERRCPDCEWTAEGVFEQPIVDRFDDALDAGTEKLLDDLNLLARANMEEQVNRFVTALRDDLVLPEDF